LPSHERGEGREGRGLGKTEGAGRGLNSSAVGGAGAGSGYASAGGEGVGVGGGGGKGVGGGGVEDERYKAPFGGRKLFVGGTRELDSEELETFFGKEFGRVASVQTAQEKFRDGSKAPRGFAFVTFFSVRDARQALERQRVNYKKGSVFAKMQVKACDGALKKEDNDYDLYTAQVLPYIYTHTHTCIHKIHTHCDTHTHTHTHTNTQTHTHTHTHYIYTYT
jgi:hypothetical protein